MTTQLLADRAEILRALDVFFEAGELFFCVAGGVP